MNVPPQLLRQIESDDVLETFVDSVGMNTCDSKIARIELCVTRPERIDPQHPPAQAKFTRRVVTRIVMPVETLAELYNALDGLRRALEQQQRQSGSTTQKN